MGPLTKRRHSTRRGGKRQAGQPKQKLVTSTAKRYVSSRKRRSLVKSSSK